jgi:hypothetical protein
MPKRAKRHGTPARRRASYASSAQHREAETVIRKDDKNVFERGLRWWSAPARSPVATLNLLIRKAVSPLRQAGDPWLRQTPNGIRA